MATEANANTSGHLVMTSMPPISQEVTFLNVRPCGLDILLQMVLDLGDGHRDDTISK